MRHNQCKPQDKFRTALEFCYIAIPSRNTARILGLYVSSPGKNRMARTDLACANN